MTFPETDGHCCVCCGNDLSESLLGQLGSLLWFRCRDCGAEQCFDLQADEVDLDLEYSEAIHA